MSEDSNIIVLDTSALFTYIEDEDGSNYVENLLIHAENGDMEIYIAFVSLTEVFYIISREKGEKAAIEKIKLIQSLEIKVNESDENLCIEAGKIKANNSISLADAYIAALTQRLKATLVHKDPEFEKLSKIIKDYKLPYKTS